jgi:hypothetical protein
MPFDYAVLYRREPDRSTAGEAESYPISASMDADACDVKEQNGKFYFYASMGQEDAFGFGP